MPTDASENTFVEFTFHFEPDRPDLILDIECELSEKEYQRNRERIESNFPDWEFSYINNEYWQDGRDYYDPIEQAERRHWDNLATHYERFSGYGEEI